MYTQRMMPLQPVMTPSWFSWVPPLQLLPTCNRVVVECGCLFVWVLALAWASHVFAWLWTAQRVAQVVIVLCKVDQLCVDQATVLVAQHVGHLPCP